MITMESVATLYLILLCTAYVAGCGLATMMMAKRSGLEGLGPLGGFLIGAGFQIFGVVGLIVWIMVRDGLKSRSR